MIIVVANRKGGTGKTTTVVNLAAVFASKGKKVLIIDLDTQGHCSHGYGLFVDSKQPLHIHDVFHQSEVSLKTAILPTDLDNISIITADTEYEGGGKVSPIILREALQREQIDKDYDFILIDTPPTLDVMLINAMSAADGVLVPFIPHHLSLVGVGQLAKLFYKVAMQYNPNLKLFGVLPVMMERHMRLHRQMLEKITRLYGQQKVLRGIRSNIKLAEAFSANKPVIHYAARSNGAMDYLLLAEEITAIWS